MNLAAGLADAYWTNTPVIAMTSATQRSNLHKFQYQGIPDMAHFEEVTKWNIDVATSDIVSEVLRIAFQTATTGCPGPVHINFHANAIFQECEIVEPFGASIYNKIPVKSQRPNKEDTDAVAKVLLNARKPVIIAGGEVIISKAWDEVIQLAEMLTIPIATSLSGKGIIPDSHYLSIGVTGLYSKATANKIVLDSDLVFFIGCKAGNMSTGNWTVPDLNSNIIQLGIEPELIGRSYKVKASMVCDPKLGLQDLIETLRLTTPNIASNSARIKEVRVIMEKWRKNVDNELNSDVIPIKCHRVIKEIRDFLSPNDILVADTGSENIWSGVFFDVLDSGRNFIHAAGSLGWSFPATIGAKLAAGEKKVVNLIGDGGIGYHIGELETALRYKIPFVSVVLNNRSWSNPRGSAEVNFSNVAKSFGAYGIRVEKPGEIAEALKEASDSDKPAIVDILVDVKENGYVALNNSRTWIKGAPKVLPFI
jgi:acetolactate synthase-1/2/3 large subunit